MRNEIHKLGELVYKFGLGNLLELLKSGKIPFSIPIWGALLTKDVLSKKKNVDPYVNIVDERLYQNNNQRSV